MTAPSSSPAAGPDDFLPLRSAASDVLSALRADESDPRSDPHRLLLSSAGTGVGHAYRAVRGGGPARGAAGGSGEKGSGSGAGAAPGSSPRGDVRSSPLGRLRGLASGHPRAPGQSAGQSTSSSTPSSGPDRDGGELPGETRHPPRLVLDRSVPLPAALAEEARRARLTSLMGLLPDAGLAWLSVDDSLHLWSYSSSLGSGVGDGSLGPGHAGASRNEDYCSMTVPSGQCVVTVGLVRPRPGVFSDAVRWCLAVTTPEEVTLCALAVGGEGDEGMRHGGGTMRLVPTRYAVPTDGTPVLSVAGTEGGRIFLGGMDGTVHEMSYEGPGTSSSRRPSVLGGRGWSDEGTVRDAIDDYFDGSGVLDLDGANSGGSGGGGMVGAALTGSKRVLRALAFGYGDDSSPSRARKCRRVDVTSAPGAIERALPAALTNIASGLLASPLESAARKGGAVIELVVDEERMTLYTLGSNGYVCVYDMATAAPAGAAVNGKPRGALPSPPRLAAVIDCVSTSKLYLDSVGRGRMYPPPTSRDASLGRITSLAGGQAGVGGMEGAREILKRHDVEARLLKASGGSGRRSGAVVAGILHPTSIHLVPPGESRSLTLVAVTAGGLRYYLSSLPGAGVGGEYSAFGGRLSRPVPGGLDPRLARTRPADRVSFCHVRAPPPLTTADGTNGGAGLEAAPSGRGGAPPFPGGMAPGVHPRPSSARGASAAGAAAAAGDVVRGCYGGGTLVLALDLEAGRKPPRRLGGGGPFAAKAVEGDVIVASQPDPSVRRARANNSTAVDGSAKRDDGRVELGIAETAELPLAGRASGIENGANGGGGPVLPGGRTFDIAISPGGTGASPSSAVANLFLRSTTPTDGELGLGLTPPYSPPPETAVGSTTAVAGSAAAPATSALVTSRPHGSGPVAVALSALSYCLGPGAGAGGGLPVGSVSDAATPGPGGRQKRSAAADSYRLSSRAGCGPRGFSRSAAAGNATAPRKGPPRRNAGGPKASTTAPRGGRSTRLSPWILDPQPAALPASSSAHLSLPPPSGPSVLVLNAGGLHLFRGRTDLDSLSSALLRAGGSVRDDASVRSYFDERGGAEAAASCLALASASPDPRVRARAADAAFANARRAAMAPAPGRADGSLEFRPSSLYDGLVRAAGRLLRPVWHRPPVVVTEGVPVRARGALANYYARVPAKVELLLDGDALREVRSPLAALRDLMRERFGPAVSSVPGAPSGGTGDDAGPMETEEVGNNTGGLITAALRNQSRSDAASRRPASGQRRTRTPREVADEARRSEDANVHSMYRLVSRSVQLLDLLSCLVRAQSSPMLPEVRWGLLHGLTFCQLVTTGGGQGRVEEVLVSLVCEDGRLSGPDAPTSADADNLAADLGRSCYLYFGAGSRLSYLGFRAARSAAAAPPGSSRRASLSGRAADYLRAAARHWTDPAVVAGGGSGGSAAGGDGGAAAAARAPPPRSPLGLAAEALASLGNASGLADLCLAVASNFGGAAPAGPAPSSEAGGDELLPPGGGTMLPWERGLYRRPAPAAAGRDGAGPAASASSPSSGEAAMAAETPSDALRCAHGTIFYYISRLLAEGGPEKQRQVEEMVATCAASKDTQFLHSLFEFLLKGGHDDLLLRIDSRDLESWLRGRDDVYRLWRFYSCHGGDAVAGDVMRERGTGARSSLPLSDRIECLARAADSYSAALRGGAAAVGGPSPSSRPAFFGAGRGAAGGAVPSRREGRTATTDAVQASLTEVKELLDVAKIQMRVLNRVLQSRDAGLGEEKMNGLKSTLLDVSTMFNDYTGPLNFCDECLLILMTCRQDLPDKIDMLWRSIICEEVLPCRTDSRPVADFLTDLKRGSLTENEPVVLGGSAGPDVAAKFEEGGWAANLKNRVSSLGSDLYGRGANFAFPLDLVLGTLEGLRRLQGGATDGGECSRPWPVQSVLDAGVPYYEIMASYESIWTGVGDGEARVHWLASIADLLELWLEAAATSFSDTGRGDSPLAQLARETKDNSLLTRLDQYRSTVEESCAGTNRVGQTLERISQIVETIRFRF